MDPKDLEKQMRAVASETVQAELIALRDQHRSNAPVQVTVAAPEKRSEKIGALLQAEWASTPGLVRSGVKADLKALVTRAGAQTAVTGGGKELDPKPLASELILSLQEASYVVKRAGMLVTFDGGSMTLGKLNQTATHAWVAEGDAAAVSTAQTASVILGSKHLSSVLPVSNQLLANPSAGPGIAQDVAAGAAAAINKGFVSGDGIGNNPSGLISQLDATHNTAANVTTQTPATIRKQLVAMVKKVRAAKVSLGAEAGAAFSMDPTTFYALMAMTDSNGGLAFPTLSNPEPTLLGFPVEIDAELGGTLFLAYAHVAVGINKDVEVRFSEMNDDAAKNSVTCHSRFIGDCKIKHNKAGAYLSGTAGWDV